MTNVIQRKIIVKKAKVLKPSNIKREERKGNPFRDGRLPATGTTTPVIFKATKCIP